MGKRNTANADDINDCMNAAEDASNAAGKIVRAIESGGFDGGPEALTHARRLVGTVSALTDLSAKLLALHEMSAMRGTAEGR